MVMSRLVAWSRAEVRRLGATKRQRVTDDSTDLLRLMWRSVVQHLDNGTRGGIGRQSPSGGEWHLVKGAISLLRRLTSGLKRCLQKSADWRLKGDALTGLDAILASNPGRCPGLTKVGPTGLLDFCREVFAEVRRLATEGGRPYRA